MPCARATSAGRVWSMRTSFRAGSRRSGPPRSAPRSRHLNPPRPEDATRPTRAGRSSAARGASAGRATASAPSSSSEISPSACFSPEVRQVEVLLVDDRRDARVDLDHVLADELDVEEVVEPELGDDRPRGLHQRRVVERLEVHREPGAQRLARLRVAERDPAVDRDPVHRPLPAGCELHHEQLGPAFVRQQLEQLLEPHRDRDSRPAPEQLRLAGRQTRTRMRKPREPDENTGFMQTSTSG